MFFFFGVDGCRNSTQIQGILVVMRFFSATFLSTCKHPMPRAGSRPLTFDIDLFDVIPEENPKSSRKIFWLRKTLFSHPWDLSQSSLRLLYPVPLYPVDRVKTLFHPCMWSRRSSLRRPKWLCLDELVHGMSNIHQQLLFPLDLQYTHSLVGW